MKRKLLSEAAQYEKQNHRRRIWRRIVSVMACIVVFCTTYALILPAITQEKTTVCGMEEHSHTESCYVQLTSRQVELLACSYETLGVHAHTQNCYGGDGTLQCGSADFVVHSHDASCADETGVIVCQLPAVNEHTHSDECYAETDTEPELICGKNEIKLHTHTDSCFETHTDESGTEARALVCEETEVLAHTHTDACFVAAEEPVDTESLTCGLDETEDHTHTALCYGTWELVCEIPAHIHTEECYPVSELTDEELAQVTAVIGQIDALESTEQVEAKLAAYEDAEDWEGYAAYREDTAQKTQTVRDSYDALSDAQKQKVTNAAKLTQLSWLVPMSTLADSSNAGTILESLDGDWAYVTDFKMKDDATTVSKTFLRTGTSPWDDDNEPGNDTDELNNILRTFDTATYTIQFNTKLRDAVAQEDVGGIERGRLYFEFVLPYGAEKAKFETDTMGWLQTSQEIKWEIVTADVNGVESQVLRGSYLLIPTGSNKAAIGASTNELNVVIRALQMHNEDTIKPVFTLWLHHNEVGATYDANDDRLPETIVTGTNHICNAEVIKKDGTVEKHDQCEAATMTGTEITVSARPMFNVGMNGVNSNNTTVGTFDFGEIVNKTGVIPTEINRDLGTMYGRMNGYGLRIELRGKTGQGMRGAELPDAGTPIQLDLMISSSYLPNGGSAIVTSTYQAQFWSGDMNAIRGDSSGYNIDGRKIYTTKDYIHSSLPFNKTKKGEEYKRCYNGGTWTFTQNSDGTIHVEISNFEFNTSSINNFPYSYTAGTRDTHLFYDPATVQNYWDIDQAVFSAGELWVVQPYYGLSNTEDKDTYIADKYGQGQFFTKVQVTSLYMKSAGGQVVDDVQEQVDLYPEDASRDGTVDDVINNGQYLKTPGGIDGRIIYTKGETRSLTQPLTDGAQQDDFDWATVGTEVTLTSWIFHSKAEAEFVGAAYDNLIKFDDEFFIPDTDDDNYKVSGIKTGQVAKVFWAALPSGNGWDDDEHMKSATPDDLVFYSSLNDLYAEEKTCIGVMVEIRGVGLESGENQLILYVDGVIREDCKTEQVYMVTRSSYAWCKKNVAAAALAYHNKKFPDNQYASTEQLSKADYNEYLQDSTNGFPSRVTNTARLLSGDYLTVDGDYPTPFWRQDYYSTNKRTGSDGTTNNVKQDGTIATHAVSALKQAQKASYNNGVYTPGVGAYYYQDSCLVIPYNVTITKSTAQSEKDSQSHKTVYDMGQNQRTVDYVLSPSISWVTSEQGGTYTGTAKTTTVYIEDTLPASLSYIPGSAYYGGSYTQEPLHQNQGTCTGAKFETTSDAGTTEPSTAHPYLETVTYNEDGTTTIRWIFKVQLEENVSSWSELIYFSCSIGTPGNEETDVKNGQGITNTVKIWTSENRSRPFTEGYGNLATFGIKVDKLTAVSLSEISDQLVMDWWDDFGFTKNVGNNSGNPKNDSIIVNTLPFDGLYRSNFTGRLVVTEFSAALVDGSGSSLGDIKFYYTTSDDYAGLLSSDYYAKLADEGLTVDQWLTQQVEADGSVWNSITMSDTMKEVAGMSLYSATDLPAQDVQEAWGTYTDGQEQQITAIIAVGDLPASATLKMHVTVKLPEGEAGDYMVSYLSQDSLSSYARAQAVNRSLEGLTWMDTDANGAQDSGEERLSGVKVSLWYWKDTKYVQYCYPNTSDPISIQTGQMISVKAESNNDAVAYDEGRYKFTDLPAGTYLVMFQSGTTDISMLVPSPVDAIEDDTLDSDGLVTYEDDGTTLKYTYINNIVMKETKDLVYGIDESKYHDSGFYYRRYELPMTGGAGANSYTMVGLVLILLSAAGLLYRFKNRRREVT